LEDPTASAKSIRLWLKGVSRDAFRLSSALFTV
jgi:hypothetical protein